jgi:hypothetical protein
MTDFPTGGNVEATRAWLDKEGFFGFFIDWKADALLGADKEDVIQEVGSENGKKLWGVLKIAKKEAGILRYNIIIIQDFINNKLRWKKTRFYDCTGSQRIVD